MTFQVLFAIFLGIVLGATFPETGEQMKFLGDMFIKLVKMVIAPLIFLTIVTGISGMGDVKKVGKLGAKTIIYFEMVTTIAILLGMLSMKIFRPGDGFDTSKASTADLSIVSKYAEQGKEAKEHGAIDFIMDVIPDNFIGAFSSGHLLQVLFIAVVFGFALSHMGEKGKAIEEALEKLSGVFFNIIHIIMMVAPFGAFGAIAFTVGKFGIATLLPLGYLLLVSVITMLAFLFGVLYPIGKFYGIDLVKIIRYIKDELLIIVGTSSSETVLPRIMEKLTKLGCSRPVVGLVVPTGYSFNLDGSSLYLAMCVLFIAQAFHIDLTFQQELTVFGIMLLTSKGAAGVVGSAFIVLAATVAATGFLPIEGLAILLGIDRVMSTVRALVNLIGNTFATVLIAKMENEIDIPRAIGVYRESLKNENINSI